MKRFMKILVMVFVCATAYALTVSLLVPNEAWAQADPFAIPKPPKSDKASSSGGSGKSDKKGDKKGDTTKKPRSGGGYVPPKKPEPDASDCPFGAATVEEGEEPRCITPDEWFKSKEGPIKKKAEGEAYTSAAVFCGFCFLLCGLVVFLFWRSSNRDRKQVAALGVKTHKRVDTLEGRFDRLEARSPQPSPRVAGNPGPPQLTNGAA